VLSAPFRDARGARAKNLNPRPKSQVSTKNQSQIPITAKFAQSVLMFLSLKFDIV
jgi:hypothetical protein